MLDRRQVQPQKAFAELKNHQLYYRKDLIITSTFDLAYELALQLIWKPIYPLQSETSRGSNAIADVQQLPRDIACGARAAPAGTQSRGSNLGLAIGNIRRCLRL